MPGGMKVDGTDGRSTCRHDRGMERVCEGIRGEKIDLGFVHRA